MLFAALPAWALDPITSVRPDGTESDLAFKQKQLEALSRLAGDVAWYRVRLTLTNGTYTPGTALGSLLCITGICNGVRTPTLLNLTIRESDNRPFDWALVRFTGPATNATVVDGSAFAFNGDYTNALTTLDQPLLSTNGTWGFQWRSLGGVCEYSADPISYPWLLNIGETNGYFAVIYTGTTNYTFTNAPWLLFGVQY